MQQNPNSTEPPQKEKQAVELFYKVALPVPFRRVYDYLPPAGSTSILPRGTRVKVPFGRQSRVGVILSHSHHSDIAKAQLKSIEHACEDFPILPESLLTLIEQSAQYYHHPIGEVALTGLPLRLRQDKPCTLFEKSSEPICIQKSPFELNTAQTEAITAIIHQASTFTVFLIEGVTGSGKTEVYLQVAEHLIKQNKQILILIPEISLTPQTVKRFQQRFGKAVFAYHSRLTPKQRYETWMRIRSGETAIVIGTRSAVFLPFQQLGLIVIDEEHDASFKQHEGFRYSARDIAVLRAKNAACPIMLGSATPAFETLANVEQGKYHRLVLPQRATNASLPTMTLLDCRHKKLDGGLSAQLIARIQSHLDNKGQVLLFINRRGYSPVMMCFDCGFMAQCDRCDARLTYHFKHQRLRCHHCLKEQKLPKQCPSCHGNALNPVGQGTERIEQTLEQYFPTTPIARIDSDATRKKGSLETLLQGAEQNQTPLLIGTQMLAKGHHFPHLSLVAIVDADGGLFSVDFRAVERMAQLIIQVAGRAGRSHQAGEVIVQTFHPDHPLLLQMLQQNYPQLATSLLTERRQCKLPPYSHWALIRAECLQAHSPETLLHSVRAHVSTHHPAVNVLGPIPAPMPKRQGHFRFQLLFQSHSRKPLHDVLRYTTEILEKDLKSKKVRWSLDVDPIEMF